MGTHSDSIQTTWWNSKQNGSAYIDFGIGAARYWFGQRVQTLKTEVGIKHFKFVGGEVDLMPPGVGVY